MNKFFSRNIRHAVLIFSMFLGLAVLGIYSFSPAPPLSKDEPAALLEKCRNVAEEAECYTRTVTALAATSGIAAGIAGLKTAAGEFDGSFCHKAAHELGHLAYSKFDGDVRRALSAAGEKPFCFNGYLHGVIHEFAARSRSEESFYEVCEAFDGEYKSVNMWSCYHGLGHGFLALAKYDLHRALDFCGMLSKDEEIREGCSSGAFMEYAWSERIPQADFNPEIGNPVSLCGAVDENFKAVCHFSMLRSYFWNNFDKKTFKTVDSAVLHVIIEKARHTCENAEKKYRPYCYYGLGYGLAFAGQEDKEKVRIHCFETDEEYRRYCLRGASRRYVTAAKEEARAFCLPLPEELRRACLEVISTPVVP